MRYAPRVVGGLLSLVVVFSVLKADAASVPLGRVTAIAGVLIDRTTGDVIWERNADLPLPPASTTKVLTALIALHSARINDVVSVSDQAALAPPSKISLKPGWTMNMRDLVYALLLNSANDAAEVVAESLGGSVDGFAERMNREARRLGAINSTFVNPHGLPADGHLSTARDLATIFDVALRDPNFREIVGTKRTVIQPVRGSRRQIALHTHNRLLDNFRVQVVGKTGWTIAAKKCFVGAALSPDGHQVLVAVLGSRSLWSDVTQLLNYGLATERLPEPPLQMARADDLELSDPHHIAAGDSDDDDDSRPASSRGHRGVPSHAPSRSQMQIASVARSRTNGAYATAPSQAKRDATRTSLGAGFSVQLATMKSAQSADRVRAIAARAGYSAGVSRVGKGKRASYVVAVQSLPNRQAAQVAATRIRRADPSLKPIVSAPKG